MAATHTCMGRGHSPPPPNRSQVCGRRQKLVLILSDVSAYDVAMAWPSVHGKDGLICADL